MTPSDTTKTPTKEPMSESDLLATIERLQAYHDTNEQHLAAVKVARADWQEKKQTQDEAKAETKMARAILDQAVAELLAFGNEKKEDDEATENDEARGLLNQPPAWRDIPIADPDEFGLPPKIIDRLEDAGIDTAGQLADFTAAHGDAWGQDIKGIGPKAQETIEDAWGGFWENHPADEPIGQDTIGFRSGVLAILVSDPEETAIKAIEACNDNELLGEAWDACTSGEVVEEWRCEAIEKRINTVEAADSGDHTVERYIEVADIAKPKQPEATANIAACTDPAILQSAYDQGLRGDWRRSLVLQRIEEINSNRPGVEDEAE